MTLAVGFPNYQYSQTLDDFLKHVSYFLMGFLLLKERNDDDDGKITDYDRCFKHLCP